MFKLDKKSLLLASLALVLTLGLFGCGKKVAPVVNSNVSQNQNSNVNTNNATNTVATTTEEIDTSNTNKNSNYILPNSIIDFNDYTFYVNDKYGYKLKYPTQYNKDKNYSIWKGNKGSNNLLDEWGVNKFQETIFDLSVYKIDSKDDLLNKNNYILTNEKIKLNNNIFAEKIDTKYSEKNVFANRLLVEKGDYLYIIYSSFIDSSTDLEAYKEFKFILDNLLFN